MYFSIAGWDVAISRSKKKVRRWGRNNIHPAQYGFVPRQVFASSDNFQREFGSCCIRDIDQGVSFRPDFSVI
jgi:hypothetical protein